MWFVDTNVIVRFLTDDHPEMARRARDLFSLVEANQSDVAISEAILVETVQILSSKATYNISRLDIGRSLQGILNLRGVRLENKPLYVAALDLYVEIPQLSFVDCLCVMYARRGQMEGVVTFDREFDRVSGVVRREP